MFSGSMVALVTPMLEDESIDFEALESLVEFHIAANTRAIVSMGTTGESASVDFSEHCLIVEKTIEFSKGRIPIIAGTGANSTSEAIELTSFAKKAGADACLLVSPYYNKPTQLGLYLHYKKIAQQVDIAQILYNVPGRTAVDILPETVEALSKIDNIIGIKEATGDLDRLAEIQKLVDDDFMLYTGDDATAIDFLLMGGHGGISVTANVAPKALSEAYDAAILGESEKAKELDAKLKGLHQHLFCESNPIPVKYALAKMNRISPAIRLPLTPLSEFCHQSLTQAMQTADVL